MPKGNKRINPNFGLQIRITKSNIRNNNGHGFDGDGYVFKKALRELRQEGMKIIYNKYKCSYFEVK